MGWWSKIQAARPMSKSTEECARTWAQFHGYSKLATDSYVQGLKEGGRPMVVAEMLPEIMQRIMALEKGESNVTQ